MKKLPVLFCLLISFIVNAQYDKAKLTNILTNGSSQTWTVKGVNTDRPEKSITFSINQSCQVLKSDGKTQPDKWNISSKDNIRWFLVIGNQSYEMIVSYDKSGSQFIKLVHQAEPGKLGTYVMNLYLSK